MCIRDRATLLCPILTMAQFNISGTVAEKNNTILPGATIRLKGKSFTTTSNENGKYEFKNLPAGNYLISVSFLGYQTKEQEVNLQADKKLDFKVINLFF